MRTLRRTQRIFTNGQLTKINRTGTSLVIFNISPRLSRLSKHNILRHVIRRISRNPTRINSFGLRLNIAASPSLSLNVFRSRIRMVRNNHRFVNRQNTNRFNNFATLINTNRRRRIISSQTRPFRLLRIQLRRFRMIFHQTPTHRNRLNLTSRINRQ